LVLNVPALSHNVRVPQVAGHKEAEPEVGQDDGEQDAHRAQVVDPLLRRRHARTAVHHRVRAIRLHVASRIVEGRAELRTTFNHTFVLFAAPVTPIGPRFVARTIASFPDVVVIQCMSKRICHDQRERNPAQYRWSPFVPFRGRIVTILGLIRHVGTQPANDHKVDD